MIFKVYQSLTGKWFYYDNISLTKRAYVVLPNDKPMGEHEVHLLTEDRDPNLSVTSMDLIFRDGSYKTLFFNEAAYLMNDDGKTIEKL